MKKLQLALMIVTLTALTAVFAAVPALAQVGAGSNVFVELSRPQCDDQGHYMPVVQDGVASVIGFASARGGVVSVTVNDVEAELFDADYRTFNAPIYHRSAGFRVALVLYPDTPLVVTATGAGGDQARAVFYPDQNATLARLEELSQQYDQDAYCSLRLGNAYAGQGDYETAYPYYHRSTGLDVRFYLGSFFLGLALYDDNRDDDAIWQFRHCTELQPTFYLARYDMGRSLDRRGNYDDAVVQFQLVIDSRPQFVEAHWRLGEAYSHRGNWDNAGTEYRTALRFNPNFAPAHQGLGAVLARQQNWDGAATELRTATKISPWNAQTRADLASTLAHQQDWTGATRQYKQAVRIAPQSGTTHQSLAQTEYATGQYGKAWDSVHAGQQAGTKPDPQFVQQLRQRMPEPKAKPVVSTPYVAPVNPRSLPFRPQVNRQPAVTTTRPPTVTMNRPTVVQPNKPPVVQTYKPPTGPAATKAPTANTVQPQSGRGHGTPKTVQDPKDTTDKTRR